MLIEIVWELRAVADAFSADGFEDSYFRIGLELVRNHSSATMLCVLASIYSVSDNDAREVFFSLAVI